MSQIRRGEPAPQKDMSAPGKVRPITRRKICRYNPQKLSKPTCCECRYLSAGLSANKKADALGPQHMVRLTGAALGLLAFAVTVFSGLAAGNTYETIVDRAIQAMFTFFALGLAVGWVGQRVVVEHTLKEHRELFPEEPASPTEPGSANPVEP